jgi:hypothetical protein
VHNGNDEGLGKGGNIIFREEGLFVEYGCCCCRCWFCCCWEYWCGEYGGIFVEKIILELVVWFDDIFDFLFILIGSEDRFSDLIFSTKKKKIIKKD